MRSIVIFFVLCSSLLNAQNVIIGRDVPPMNGESVSDTFFFFDESKGAFRGGRIFNSDNWSSESIGDFSFGFGYNVKAMGKNSIAMGYETNASGLQSTAMGHETNASGLLSTAMGSFTTASGDYSTALGSITTASGNGSTAIGVGSSALSYAEIAFGTYNSSSNPHSSTTWETDDRLFVVGNGSGPFARSDAMVVLKNGNTAIGTSVPEKKLHVKGQVKIEAIDVNSDVNFLMQAGGGMETRILTLQEGSNNIYMGAIDDINSDVIMRAAGDDVMVLGSTGNIAVKNGNFYTENSANSLGTSGSRWSTAWLTNGINDSSDERLKKNIQNLNYGLKEIRNLRPVSYEWKENSVGTKLGLIAQEINKVIPEVVHVPENPEEFLSVNYAELIPVLINAIQEQQEIIENQEKKLAEFRNSTVSQDAKMETIMVRLEKLEKIN